MRQIWKGVRFVVLAWLGVFLFFGLIAATGAAELVASATDGTRYVDLYKEACSNEVVNAKIDAERESFKLRFDGFEPKPMNAEYRATANAKREKGCWFIHPMAPMVVMVWEDGGTGIAPMEMFEAPAGK